MSPEVKSALLGVSGALLVWIVSWLWSLHLDHRTGKRVRTMLSLEIDENLHNLTKWRESAKKSVTFSQGVLPDMQYGDALGMLDLPAWGHGRWQEGLQLIPIALDEEEIRHVHRFHQRLDEVSEFKKRNHLRSEFEELGNLVDGILKSGNPLKKS